MAASKTDSISQRVLIVGGGIAGLCLAQGLKKHGIPFTVFERDASIHARAQGYRLRINNDGTNALESCLPADIFDLFKKSTADFVLGFNFLDAQTAAKPATSDPTNGMRIPRPSGSSDPSRIFSADRVTLRSVLLTGLSEEELRFGMSLDIFQYIDDKGLVEAVFENGERATGGLLIDATGSSSRIRKQYIPDEITVLDTDGRAIFGKTLLTPEFEAAFPPPALQTTTLFTNASPNASLFCEPMRFKQGSPHEIAPHLPHIEDYLYWVLVARSELFRHCGFSSDSDLYEASEEELMMVAREVTATWDPRIQTVLDSQHQSTCSFTRFTTVSPNMKAWNPTRVTLLGDAIHAMTPAGVGANIALKDAQVLLEKVLEHGVSIEAVLAYETEMREYAIKAIVETAPAGKSMYGQPPFEDMATC